MKKILPALALFLVLMSTSFSAEAPKIAPKDAAMVATREIALAVLATTLSLVVIFLPIPFMEGRTGRFFASYGVTVTFAILVSMFVSFTLTPMLCSIMLRHTEDPVLRRKRAECVRRSGVRVVQWACNVMTG